MRKEKNRADCYTNEKFNPEGLSPLSFLLFPLFFLIFSSSMFRNSFLRALIVLGIGVALVGYADVALRYIVQALGVLFIIPGLVTAFSGMAKREGNEAMPVLPLIAGGGSVLLGVVLLLIPEFFISILLYLLAALLLLGGGIQITQLVLMRREGMTSSWVYYLFPATIFVVGIYILVYPMETASLPFLFIGYAAILYGVVELLTLMRVSYFRRKAQMMAEREAKTETELVEAETTVPTENADASKEA